MYYWLLQVLEKLEVLFAGYNDYPPTAMVMMGNFLSSKQGSQLARTLKAKLGLLADLLAKYQNLVKNTRFVIVPGPADCLTANILPRWCYLYFSNSNSNDKNKGKGSINSFIFISWQIKFDILIEAVYNT